MRVDVMTALLLMVASGHAANADVLEEALKDCDKNQLTLNFCARDAFDVADAELNSLFKQQMARLQSEKTKQRLLDAQRAWLTFRDKDCLYEVGTQEESGSIWPLIYWKCMEQHTARRVSALRAFVSCTEEGCPR